MRRFLLSNARKTDSIRWLEDRVLLPVWCRACAAFALLSSTRKTDSLRRFEDRVLLPVWRRACAAFALLSNSPQNGARPGGLTGCYSRISRAGTALCGLLTLVAIPLLAQPRPRVYISVDMEGIAGVVTAEQLQPSGFEYQRFREFMKEEALAAVQAAIAHGADVLVADSHGNGQNLLIEKFPESVRLIRSWPRRQGMMAGLDSGFQAAIFIGYHASATNPQGVRAHTVSSALLTHVALNGRNVSEGVINAAIAGHYNVPVIFISGDDAVIAEVSAAIGPVQSVETKKALGFHAANSITPAAARRQIQDGVRTALSRLSSFQPFRIASPVTLGLSFKHYTAVELLSWLPNVQRTGARSIKVQTRDVLEADDFIQFATEYKAEMQP